jgi:hypothetical protein
MRLKGGGGGGGGERGGGGEEEEEEEEEEEKVSDDILGVTMGCCCCCWRTRSFTCKRESQTEIVRTSGEINQKVIIDLIVPCGMEMLKIRFLAINCCRLSVDLSFIIERLVLKKSRHKKETTKERGW